MTDYCFIECVMMSSSSGAAVIWLVERMGFKTDSGKGCPLVEKYQHSHRLKSEVEPPSVKAKNVPFLIETLLILTF